VTKSKQTSVASICSYQLIKKMVLFEKKWMLLAVQKENLFKSQSSLLRETHTRLRLRGVNFLRLRDTILFSFRLFIQVSQLQKAEITLSLGVQPVSTFFLLLIITFLSLTIKRLCCMCVCVCVCVLCLTQLNASCYLIMIKWLLTLVTKFIFIH